MPTGRIPSAGAPDRRAGKGVGVGLGRPTRRHDRLRRRVRVDADALPGADARPGHRRRQPAYLATTGRALDELVGRDVFEAFPGNPYEGEPDGGVGKVRPRFEKARDTGRPHTMPVQEYDIPDGTGGFASASGA